MPERNTEVFNSLIVGVKEYLAQGRKYPYPDSLCMAMNALALEMSEKFPKTISGFLRLLENPVKDWCPNHFISKDFDINSSVVNNGKLSEEATDYLNRKRL